MPRKPVSLSLDEANLLWLRGRAAALSRGNLSEAVDRLIAQTRAGRLGEPPAARSVVGTIDIAGDDPQLEQADAAVRELFAASLRRPLMVRERRSSLPAKKRRRRG